MTRTDIALTDAELSRLRLLLADAAGLVFEDSRRDSLSYSVAERLRLTGIRDIATYLDVVAVPGAPERQRLLDEVTIQETHFFRNPPQMQALRQHVLPELIRLASTSGRRLRIWSAGCSTGEEPYTIAMMLRELLPNMDGWDVQVLATDISESALGAARSATYNDRAVQLASPEERERFFLTTGEGVHRTHQVRQEVRDLVRFSHHNLVLEPPPDGGLDLVLCRNVTIYFGRETTRALVRRMHTALRDGGYLFIGHSETLWQINDDFRLVSFGVGGGSAYVYRRLDLAPVKERRASGAGARATSMTVERRANPRRGRPGTARRAEQRTPGLPAAVAPAGVAIDAVRTAMAQGHYEEAARLTRLAAVADPLQAKLHYLLGHALISLGRDSEALPALRRAVYLDPDAGLAHFLLAGALARSGDIAAAAREYRAAAATLGRSPDDADAPELGGRSVRELAALCAQVEGQLSRQVDDDGRDEPESQPLPGGRQTRPGQPGPISSGASRTSTTPTRGNPTRTAMRSGR
jgi:chemotaxis protein methyltransferase CheR